MKKIISFYNKFIESICILLDSFSKSLDNYNNMKIECEKIRKIARRIDKEDERIKKELKKYNSNYIFIFKLQGLNDKIILRILKGWEEDEKKVKEKRTIKNL